MFSSSILVVRVGRVHQLAYDYLVLNGKVNSHELSCVRRVFFLIFDHLNFGGAYVSHFSQFSNNLKDYGCTF
jgi:hypothetical protein